MKVFQKITKCFSNKSVKKIMLLLCVCMFMSSLSGCGVLGIGKETEENGITGNELLIESETDKCLKSIYYKPNATTETVETDLGGLWFLVIDGNRDYGFKANGTLMRDVAIWMFQSIFPETNQDATTDDDRVDDPNWNRQESTLGYGYDDYVRDALLDLFNGQDPNSIKDKAAENSQKNNGDTFSGSFRNEDWATFTLSPVTLTQQINEEMSKILKADGPMKDVSDAIASVAAAILITMWAMSFISQIVNEKFSIDTLIKSLMQLLCGIVIIKNADLLVSAFVDAGNWLINEFNPGQDSSPFIALKNDLYDKISTVNVINFGFSVFGINMGLVSFWICFGAISAILFMIIPCYFLMQCAFKIISTMIIRTIELTLRITLAPIPLSFSVQSGFGQEVMRYFRSTMACALHPLLIMLGACSVDAISAAVLKVLGYNPATITGIPAVIALSLIYLILNAYIGETKHMAREIINGH